MDAAAAAVRDHERGARLALRRARGAVRPVLDVDTDRYRAVLRRTILRRTLLWVPVSLVPFLLFALAVRPLRGKVWSSAMVGAEAGAWIGAALACAALLAIAAMVLMLWAALSLLVLRSFQDSAQAPMSHAAFTSATANRGAAPPSRPWVLAAVALLLCGVGAAGMNKMFVVHHYLRLTDARYQPAVRSNRHPFQHLENALVKSACKGDLAFLKKLIGEVLDLAIGLDGDEPTERCDDVPIGPHELVYLDGLETELRQSLRATGGLR